MKIKKSHGDRIEALQTVRALAFLGICSGHCSLTKLGAWGVAVFFNLSGFLMVYRYYTDEKLETGIISQLKFGLRKIMKLYPLHILMMIAALILHIKLGGKVSFFNIFSNILLIQSWIPSMGVYFSLNGVAWYLSTILFLYMMFPLILLKIKKIQTPKTAIRLIILIYALQCFVAYCAQIFTDSFNIVLPDFIHWLTYICPLFRAGDFLIGGLLAYIYLNKKTDINQKVATVQEILPFILLVVVQLLWKENIFFFGKEFFKNTLLYIPAAACFVFIFARHSGFISKILSCKLIRYIGDLSGYNFLIHGIVISYITTIFIGIGINLTPLIKFIICLPISLICSEIYKRIQRSILSIKKIYKN